MIRLVERGARAGPRRTLRTAYHGRTGDRLHCRRRFRCFLHAGAHHGHAHPAAGWCVRWAHASGAPTSRSTTSRRQVAEANAPGDRLRAVTTGRGAIVSYTPIHGACAPGRRLHRQRQTSSSHYAAGVLPHIRHRQGADAHARRHSRGAPVGAHAGGAWPRFTRDQQPPGQRQPPCRKCRVLERESSVKRP